MLLYVPASYERHEVAKEEFVVPIEYLPSEQSEQATIPFESAIFPAGQAAHEECGGVHRTWRLD